MALPLDGGGAARRQRFDAAIAGLPAVAERLAGSRAPHADPRRGADRPPRGRRRRARAGCSSATRPGSSTRSPARASTARCARPARPRSAMIGRRRRRRALPRRAAARLRRQVGADLAGPGLPGRPAAARARRRAARPSGRPPRCAWARRSATAGPATDALSPRALLEVLVAVKSELHERMRAPFERDLRSRRGRRALAARSCPTTATCGRLRGPERRAALRDGRPARADPGALGGDPATDA